MQVQLGMDEDQAAGLSDVRDSCWRAVRYYSHFTSTVPETLAQLLKFMLGANGYIIIAPPVQELHKSPYAVGNNVFMKLLPLVCQASSRRDSVLD